MAENIQNSQIFIVYGALRSGSTLLRLLLDAHPQISCSGERDFMLDYQSGPPGARTLDLKALAKDRIFRASGLDSPVATDGQAAFFEMACQDRDRGGKTVHVLMLHRHLGRLEEMFPDAKVTHLVRDPRDVARSSIGMGWAGNTWFGVDHWLGTERAWDHHSQLTQNAFTLRYERLLEDPRTKLEQLCAFMGVPFSEKMFEYSERSSYSALDPKLAFQWRRKQTPDQIADVEFKAGGLMRARGYTPHNDPVRPTGLVRRLLLFLQDKLFRLRFNARRYGWGDTIRVTLSNKLRRPELAGKARMRIEEKSLQYLK